MQETNPLEKKSDPMLFLNFEAEKLRIAKENGIIYPEKLTNVNGKWFYNGMDLDAWLRITGDSESQYRYGH